MHNLQRLLSSNIRVATALLAIASAACSTSTLTSSLDVQHIELDQSVVLPLGATVVVDGTPLRVTFISVKSDSRCPLGMLCIWAGDADIVLRLDAGSGAAEADVHSDVDPRITMFAGYRIELVDIQPSRTQDNKPLAYLATLRITHP